MAKSGAHGKDKQRCGAKVRTRKMWHGGQGSCRRWPVDGLFGRCHLHGGKSTGPKTPEGKARVVAAMVAGRKRWLEHLKAEGKKVPCGPYAKKYLTKLKKEIEDLNLHYEESRRRKAMQEYTPPSLPNNPELSEFDLKILRLRKQALEVLGELNQSG